MRQRCLLALVCLVFLGPRVNAQEPKPGAQVKLEGRQHYITKLAFSPDGNRPRTIAPGKSSSLSKGDATLAYADRAALVHA